MFPDRVAYRFCIVLFKTFQDCIFFTQGRLLLHYNMIATAVRRTDFAGGFLIFFDLYLRTSFYHTADYNVCNSTGLKTIFF
jgi:hypothetical protein